MILLVNPWIHDFSAYDLWIKPLGLLYLAGVLQEHDFDLAYIDCLDNRYDQKEDGRARFVKQNLPTPPALHDVHRKYGRYGIDPQQFRSRLRSIRPEPEAILVTSGMTYWYPGVQETIGELRAVFPESKILLGGIYATLMTEHARAFSGADQVIAGQSENKIVQLLRGSDGRSYPRADNYPLPAWNLTNESRYRILYTSRGCPYRCTFCASDVLNAERFDQRDVENVYREIAKYYFEDNIRHFVFYDDALLINHRRHLEPLLQKIRRSEMKLYFHTPNGLNAREIDQQVADLMHATHFSTIRLSLESVNPEIQKVQANRKINNQLFESAIRNLYRAGYGPGEIECYLIMGLPGQSAEDVRASLQFVGDLGVIARLATFSPIPGTPEAKAAQEIIGDAFFKEPLLQNHSCFPLRDFSLSQVDLQDIKLRCNEQNGRIKQSCPTNIPYAS